MRALALLLFLTAGSAVPAFCQVGLGLDLETFGLRRKAPWEGRRSPPVAMAISSVFGSELWERVDVSTAGAVSDLTRMVRQGYYKLEILQLVMIAAESEKALKVVLARRKKGERLRKIAEESGLDFRRLYDAALAVQEIVDREYLWRHPERRYRKRHE